MTKLEDAVGALLLIKNNRVIHQADYAIVEGEHFIYVVTLDGVISGIKRQPLTDEDRKAMGWA